MVAIHVVGLKFFLPIDRLRSVRLRTAANSLVSIGKVEVVLNFLAAAVADQFREAV